MLLIEDYETYYGIYNHNLPETNKTERTMPLVRMHPAEDVITGGRLFERIQQFHAAKVFPKFGLSWSEFMDLPSYICEEILRVSKEADKAENKHAEEEAKKAELAMSMKKNY